MTSIFENIIPIIFVGILLVGSLFVMLWIAASIYRQVPPNRALIVYGWGGRTIVTSGGKLVIPMIQSYK
jgi:flotillin